MCWVEETKIAQTRKAYRCEWCWQIIEKGQPCYRHRGISDGSYFTARLHPECAELRVNQLEYCETYLPGSGDRPTTK